MTVSLTDFNKLHAYWISVRYSWSHHTFCILKCQPHWCSKRYLHNRDTPRRNSIRGPLILKFKIIIISWLNWILIVKHCFLSTSEVFFQNVVKRIWHSDQKCLTLNNCCSYSICKLKNQPPEYELIFNRQIVMSSLNCY